MANKTSVGNLFLPIDNNPCQAYFGNRAHTLGIVRWLLEQTGPAYVFISTFSTSEEFLRGFHNIRRDNLVKGALLLADFKAWKKTEKLSELVKSNFEEVYLGKNHSKLILICNERYHVTVVSSQNQTYGDRAESTIIETNNSLFWKILNEFNEITHSSYVLHTRAIKTDSAAGVGVDPGDGDWRPFGY